MGKDCVKEIVNIFDEIFEIDLEFSIGDFDKAMAESEITFTNNFVRDYQNKFIECFSKPENRTLLIKEILRFNANYETKDLPDYFVNSVWYFSLVRYKSMHIPLPIFLEMGKYITNINKFSFRTINYYNGNYFADEPEDSLKEYYKTKERVFREADESEMVLVINVAGMETVATYYTYREE